ncbi:hypothetical protein IP88_13915 [alpha proteobacterium AAP81b]|nr:hypothetical protein IP88_13915 [alpha proteobacterium AAP81b]
MSAVALGALLGLVLGSFIAVLTLRWPAGEGLGGRSRCDSCAAPLRWFELVPVLSFALQAGRCRRCGAAIPLRHLAIEIVAALIGGLALGVSPAAIGWAGAGFGWGLLALAVLDAEHFWLPDALTLPLLAAGLLAGLWLAPPLAERAWGAAAGYASLAAIAAGYRALTGRDGLGGGDPKLLAAIGAWLGWPLLAPVVLAAALLGLALALVDRARGVAVDRLTAVPLGALLAAAAFPIWLLFPTGAPALMLAP